MSDEMLLDFLSDKPSEYGSKRLDARLLDFVVSLIFLLRALPQKSEYTIIKRQLIRSAGSVGANYEEAQAASSKADFSNKIKIALKEIRETCYWLEILNRIVEFDNNSSEELRSLRQEAMELKSILGAIAVKVSSQVKSKK